jgi:hypothetical protein
MPAIVYTGADLVRSLREQFPAVGFPVIMNTRYVAVSRDWVSQRFTAYIWAFEQARGQLTYSKRGNQCEHYALRAALEVVDLLRQMPADQVPADVESIAVAAVKYEQNAGTPMAVWHEVVLWFFAGQWFPWEPQRRAFFTFTEAERLTVQQAIIP